MSIVIALVVTPVLVHGLGGTAYGIWALVGSTVLYLDLFNLGFGRAQLIFGIHRGLLYFGITQLDEHRAWIDRRADGI